MNDKSYDLSDLAPESSGNQSYDLSDLSPESSTQKILGDIQQTIESQKPPYKTIDVPLLGTVPDIHDPEAQKYIKNEFTPSMENVQRGASAVLPFIAPEIRAVPFLSNILSKIPLGKAVGNAFGRIGYGTALNTAPDLFSKEGREQFPDRLKGNLLLNSLLEGVTTPFRISSAISEFTNPIKYANQKASQINAERAASKATMDEMYRPINEQYDNYNVTVTPKQYLKGTGVNRKDLYPDAKLTYDRFIREPTFGNLHKLKSKIGSDWARVSSHPATTEKAQLFAQMRDRLEDKAHQYLSQDENALNQYKNATAYAKNTYYPYLSSPTLRDISKSKNIQELELTPEKLARSLKTSMKKTVGSGENERFLIPERHALRNHLKDIKGKLNRAKLANALLPVLGGVAAGEYLHPGYEGAIGGALTGLGYSGLNKLYKNTVSSDVIQNPIIENLANELVPFYYKSGRSLIGGNQ